MTATATAGPTGTNIDILTRELGYAICERYAPGSITPQQREAAEQWRGVGLHDICRILLRASGEEIPHNPADLFQRTISTASLPALLGDSLNKLLQASYQSAEPTSVQWAGRKEVANFHEFTGIKFDGVAELEPVADGGELKHGSFIESTETGRLETKGKRVTLTRKQFVDDNLDAFARIPQILARAAARSVDNAVYSLLATGGGTGPTLNEDGKALFATDHSGPTGKVPASWPAAGVANYISSGAPMTEAGLSAARTLFRKLRSLSGELLNVRPAVLLVPAAMEFNAMRLTRSATLAPSGQTSSTAMEGTFNPHSGALRVVVEPRLDDIDANAFYLVAPPTEQPSISIAYLRGQTGPTLERKDPTDVLGLGWWIYFDFGVYVEDWRGITRNKA